MGPISIFIRQVWREEVGSGCGWFLGGGCRGGSSSPLSAFSIVFIVAVFIFVVGVVGFIFVSGIGMLSLP